MFCSFSSFGWCRVVCVQYEGFPRQKGWRKRRVRIFFGYPSSPCCLCTAVHWYPQPFVYLCRCALLTTTCCNRVDVLVQTCLSLDLDPIFHILVDCACVCLFPTTRVNFIPLLLYVVSVFFVATSVFAGSVAITTPCLISPRDWYTVFSSWTQQTLRQTNIPYHIHTYQVRGIIRKESTVYLGFLFLFSPAFVSILYYFCVSFLFGHHREEGNPATVLLLLLLYTAAVYYNIISDFVWV